MLNLCKTPKVDGKLDIHLEIFTGKINLFMDQLEADEFISGIPQWPILLTWFNFNPIMDK